MLARPAPSSGSTAHKNFLVTAGDKRVVVKLWNRMWEEVVVVPPPPIVFHNTRLARDVGVGAPVVAVVQEPPLALVIDFLPGQVMDQSSENCPGWRPRLVSCTTRASGSRTTTTPSRKGRKMFAVARHRGVSFPDAAPDLERDIARVEQVLDLRVNEFVPCHNDLYGANILESGGALRLVDYDLV